jgi:hypothetical protein
MKLVMCDLTNPDEYCRTVVRGLGVGAWQFDLITASRQDSEVKNALAAWDALRLLPMDSASDYVQAAIDRLKADRADLTASIDEQIATLQAALRTMPTMPVELNPTPNVVDTNPIGRVDNPETMPAVPGGRSIKAVALDLAANTDVFSLQQVIATCHTEGNMALPPSISSVISRMVSDGLLAKGPRRGTYMKPMVVDPMDSMFGRTDENEFSL